MQILAAKGESMQGKITQRMNNGEGLLIKSQGRGSQKCVKVGAYLSHRFVSWFALLEQDCGACTAARARLGIVTD